MGVAGSQADLDFAVLNQRDVDVGSLQSQEWSKDVCRNLFVL